MHKTKTTIFPFQGSFLDTALVLLQGPETQQSLTLIWVLSAPWVLSIKL